MSVHPCPFCRWQIPDHMAWPRPGELIQHTRCPNGACGADLLRHRAEVDVDWSDWRPAAAA